MTNLKVFAASAALVPTAWMRAVDPATHHVQADVVLVAATKKAAVQMLTTSGLSDFTATRLVAQTRMMSPAPYYGSVKALREAGVADGTEPGAWVYRSAQAGLPVVCATTDGLPTVAHFQYRESREARDTGLPLGLYAVPFRDGDD